jgi:hypothetical protein
MYYYEVIESGIIRWAGHEKTRNPFKISVAKSEVKTVWEVWTYMRK